MPNPVPIPGAVMGPSGQDINSSYLFIPFSIVVASPAIPANGSLIVPVTLDQDGDFELHYILGTCSADTPANIFNNNFSVKITDKSNSRIWSSDYVPAVILCGPTNYSIPERRPVLIARKTNMSFDILNLTAGNNTVTLVLRGYKVRAA